MGPFYVLDDVRRQLPKIFAPFFLSSVAAIKASIILSKGLKDV